MLRAWLVLLKRGAMAGRRLPAGTTFGIVTGERELQAEVQARESGCGCSLLL